MFVWSFKASTFKLIGVIVACAALLALLIGIIPSTGSFVQSSVAVINPQYNFEGVTNAEKGAEFAKQFNINVKLPQSDAAEFRIPSNFDAVMEKYNDIQRQQGMNLEKYKNKQVTRYTYVVLDADGNETENLLSLIVYKDRVVGGDISSTQNGGFVSGFII